MIDYVIVSLLLLNLLAYALTARGNRLAIKRCDETLAALDAMRDQLVADNAAFRDALLRGDGP